MFRTSFNYSKPLFWYPSHQAKALKQLQDGLCHIDLVIEVRDARIPLTSIHPLFEQTFGQRDRLILYNKADLANPQLSSRITSKIPSSIFISVLMHQHLKHILTYAINKCKKDPARFPYLSMIVVGLPNVGKSSLINALRKLGVNKGKVAQVGPTAGVTRKISTRVKIHQDPPIYLVDTPGIFDPIVSDPIQGLKIALTGATKDRLTMEVHVVDYLLFRMNQYPTLRKSWPLVFKLPEATDEVDVLLKHVAIQNQFYLVDPRSNKKIWDPSVLSHEPGYAFAFQDSLDLLASQKRPDMHQGQLLDIDRAARHVLTLYRQGAFGRMTLDDCSPDAIDSFFEKRRFQTF